MKRIALVCSVGLLCACAQANLEEQSQPAAELRHRIEAGAIGDLEIVTVISNWWCAQDQGAHAARAMLAASCQ